MISYRLADITDADVLAKIRSIFLAEANDVKSKQEQEETEIANKEYFRKALADESFVSWVALDKEKIVATSGLCFYIVPPSVKCPDGKTAYIMNMFTFPEYRKQGIGMELLKRIVDEAKKRGYKKVTLAATEMGKPLYLKYGFNDISNDMVYYI